jgi:hypothetical protein
MLLWLSGAENARTATRTTPGADGLFTLGEAQLHERDVREQARRSHRLRYWARPQAVNFVSTQAPTTG